MRYMSLRELQFLKSESIRHLEKMLFTDNVSNSLVRKQINVVCAYQDAIDKR